VKGKRGTPGILHLLLLLLLFFRLVKYEALCGFMFINNMLDGSGKTLDRHTKIGDTSSLQGTGENASGLHDWKKLGQDKSQHQTFFPFFPARGRGRNAGVPRRRREQTT